MRKRTRNQTEMKVHTLAESDGRTDKQDGLSVIVPSFEEIDEIFMHGVVLNVIVLRSST